MAMLKRAKLHLLFEIQILTEWQLPKMTSWELHDGKIVEANKDLVLLLKIF